MYECLPEGLVAQVAKERLLVGVLQHVCLEVALRGRRVRAQVALEAFLALMGLYSNSIVILYGFIVFRTCIRRMYIESDGERLFPAVDSFRPIIIRRINYISTRTTKERLKHLVEMIMAEKGREDGDGLVSRMGVVWFKNGLLESTYNDVE